MLPANDGALQRLANALALGDGFQFHILVCHSPVQVRQCLDALAEAVPARRGGRLHTQRLMPDTPSTGELLDGAQLTAAITAGLSALPLPAADERVLAVLDASFVADAEVPAWRQLFRRLNEQRNALAGTLDAALLLCLSPTLEPIFAREAPDFWSIRGVSVRLDAQPLAAPPSSQLGKEISSGEVRNLALTTAEEEIPVLRLAVSALRHRISLQPDDPNIQHTLAIQLGLLGDLLHVRNRSNEALEAYRETQRLMEGLTTTKPERADYQRDLAVSYQRLGDLMTALGQGEAARDYFIKDLDIAQRLAQAEPQRADYQRDLIVSLVKLSEIAPATATQHLTRALSIAQSLKAGGAMVHGLDWMLVDLAKRLEQARHN